MSENPYRVLKNREFMFLVGMHSLTTLAVQIQSVAVAWQVYSITKDPLSLGLIGLAEIIPAIGCALFAGHVVDRSDRKRVLMGSNLLTVAVYSFLLFLSLDLVRLEGRVTVALLYSAIFLTGIARAFFSPSRFALFSQIVAKPDYVRAAAWNSTAWQVAAAAGPAMGGLIYGFAGARAAYVVAWLLLILAFFCLTRIRARGVPEFSANESMQESLLLGLRFVFRDRVILSTLSLDLFAVLFGGAVALLPVFADLLNAGPQGLGLMRAAPSLGAFFMAFYLAHRPPTRRAGVALLFAIAGFGICTILFALSKSLAVSLAVLALSGAFDAVSVVVRGTVLQLLTPDKMRGRVSAVNSIFIGSSNEIGAFESGVTAKWMGTIPAVVFGGCMTLVVVASTAWFSPEIRQLDLNEVEKSGA